MVRRGPQLCLTALLAVAFLVSPAPSLAERETGEHEEERSQEATPLEQAREEAGVDAQVRTRYGLPSGSLRIDPSELVAARSGQRIRFSVELDAPAEGATLSVELPARWLARSDAGLEYARASQTVEQSVGGAHLERRGRTLALTIDGAQTGVATFEVEDVGIAPGTYTLPFSWHHADGRTTAAGSARVVFYAPAREAVGEAPWQRLAPTSTSRNVSDDDMEESETFIAVTPGNKNRIAVGANSGSPMSAWITDDGGASWQRQLLPSAIDAPGEPVPEAGRICCDPMFAADPLGNIWYGGLSVDNGAGVPSRIVVNRIAAGTETFQPLTTGLPVRTGGLQDKPMMTIDNSPASPTFGRLYVVWNEPTQSGGVNVVISQCDTRPGGVADAARCDNGDNWTTPASVTPLSGGYIYADVAVGPRGRLYVVWWDYSSANAIQALSCNPVVTSCTSGTGWGEPHTVAQLDATAGSPVPFACEILAQPGGRASTAPQVEVDRAGGPNDGRVYVTWSDLRTGSGTTRCDGSAAQLPAPSDLTFDSYVASAPAGTLPGEAAPSEVVGTRLVKSEESAESSDDWLPGLTIDQTTGQAWTDFYSTRVDPGRRLADLYVRSVTPNGTSHDLGPLVRLSAASSDRSDPMRCCDFKGEYGDYTGIDATNGVVYPVWADNSSGARDGEAFTYAAAVAPKPAASASPDDQPPKIRLRARRVAVLRALRQRRKLTVFARCSERCRATLSGKTMRARASRKPFRRLVRSLSARHETKLRLRLSRRALRSARRALARHRRVSIRIFAKATDKAGNAGFARRSVRLLRHHKKPGNQRRRP